MTIRILVSIDRLERGLVDPLAAACPTCRYAHTIHFDGWDLGWWVECACSAGYATGDYLVLDVPEGTDVNDYVLLDSDSFGPYGKLVCADCYSAHYSAHAPGKRYKSLSFQCAECGC